jgi:hypothetical protein
MLSRRPDRGVDDRLTTANVGDALDVLRKLIQGLRHLLWSLPVAVSHGRAVMRPKRSQVDS